MDNSIETFGLFPIPVTTIQLDPIPEETKNFIKNLEYMPWRSSDNYYKDMGHDKEHYLSISVDRQALDLPELKDLKDQIMTAAEHYWREVICADYSTNLVIRHCWITRHRKGEKNPPHIHTTSLFVGSIYVQAPENCGDIIFYKDNNYLNLFPSLIDMDYHNRNLINTKKFSITPRENMAVFFPSHVNHETEINNSDEDRYALNLDFWFEGTVRQNSKGFEVQF
jgi:uncharacterized protein (TIGR02466 family)